MGAYGVGARRATKPDISVAAYIARTGDYCNGCRLHPASTRPITPLHRAFLAWHAGELGRSACVDGPLRSARKRDQKQRARDSEVFEPVSSDLASGRAIRGESRACLVRQGRITLSITWITPLPASTSVATM